MASRSLARRILFLPLLLLSLFFARPAHAQTAPSLDADGGLISMPCSGGATSHFYTEKDSNGKWWFCTPEGNRFHANALANMEVPGVNARVVWTPGVLLKYGGSTNTAAQDSLIKYMQNYHFNEVGELSNSMLYPWMTTCTGCASYPGFQSVNVSVYATVNLNNNAARPVKNYIVGLDDYFTDYRGAGCTDSFDPQYPVFADALFKGPGVAFLSNAHVVGAAVDDTDFQCGMGSSEAFDTFPVGHNKANIGFIALLTSPVETMNPGASYQGKVELFTDTTVYSKALSANPPTSLLQCWSLSNTSAPPCSLADFLSAKYGGDVAALNAAWGSNYTTLGSSGTPVSITCGTGDGSTLSFTCDLPTTKGTISPLSVAVLEGTSLIGGDCAWFEGKCAALTNPKPPYNCAVAGTCEGVVEGDASSPLKRGVQAWLSDNPCGAAGANPSAPNAAFVARIIWHGSGSYIPSRQTGETCAAGDGDFITIPLNAPADATGYDVYMACQLKVSATPAFGCAPDNAVMPAPTLQAANVTLGTSFVIPSSGLIAGASLPAPPSFIDYGTGSITLAFGTAPPSGAAITVNAVAGGWMWGTGLLDEDGRNTWIRGTAAKPSGICMFAYDGTSGDGSDGYACRSGNPGGNSAATVAPQVGADVSEWQYQEGARYFGSIRSALKAAFPNLLYFGPNVLGDWDGPAHKELLQVAGAPYPGGGKYLDVIFTPGYNTHMTDIPQRLNFLFAYLGDVPNYRETFLEASADSAESACSSCVNNEGTYANQPARGTAYYDLVTNCLAEPHCVGQGWWGSADFNGAAEVNDWGLTTPTDNDYNGSDPSAGSLPCRVFTSMTCGNEPAPGGATPGVRPFGDALTGSTGVIAANLLWQNPANSVPGGTTQGLSITVNNPAPTLSSISPSQLNTTDAGPVTLTLTGSGFMAGSTVTWNGTALTANFVSATQLTASLPSTAYATPGTFTVVVTNPTPGGGSAQSTVTVVDPAPVVSSVSPSQISTNTAGPLTLTITGSNFTSAATVTWNGSALASGFTSSTQLTASLPAADYSVAGTYTVVVVTAGGSAQQTVAVVNPPLAVSTTSLPAATVGAAYSQSLSGTGGVPPYTWTISGGALPTGLTMSSSGVISGTPTTAGTFAFSVRLTDASGTSVAENFGLLRFYEMHTKGRSPQSENGLD